MARLWQKLLVLFSYVAVVAVNYLANALPLNNLTTGEVSDAYPNLFAPAGITFSIWGVIYLLLALFVLYYLGLFGRDRKVPDRIAYLFIATCIANIVWIFSWHYLVIWLSVIWMLVLLASLILLASALRGHEYSSKEYWFVRLPFSVYFGWVTVATIANITVFLVSIGWNGFGLPDAFWMIIVLVIGMAICLWRSFKDLDVAYVLVFIWAYIGILIKHVSDAGFAGHYGNVVTTIIVCLVVFAAWIGFLLYRLYRPANVRTKK